MVYIKREFSKNTTEIFTKIIFHYVPEILKLVRNRMAVLKMNEMIKNEDRMKENETEADILTKSEEENIEYIFVLKDKKIPTLLTEFLTLVSLPTGNREI